MPSRSERLNAERLPCPKCNMNMIALGGLGSITRLRRLNAFGVDTSISPKTRAADRPKKITKVA
jgi:hypothetical protein